VSRTRYQHLVAGGLLTVAVLVSLTMPVPTRAAQTKSAKTELVAFDTSPFPYAGQPPGQDKPFWDVEQDGRRGHSSPRGGVYWEDATYSDRRVLLHIPRGFNPSLPAVMIVYLHGNMANLEGVVHRHQQVPRQVSESGLNAVLVAPQFAVNALDSSAGRFYEAGHFRSFVEEAGVRLARLNGDPRARTAIESLQALMHPGAVPIVPGVSMRLGRAHREAVVRQDRHGRCAIAYSCLPRSRWMMPEKSVRPSPQALCKP